MASNLRSISSQSPQDPFFDEQWRQALKVSPPFLFLTNFNEWIAQAQHDEKRRSFVGHEMKPGEAFFCGRV